MPVEVFGHAGRFQCDLVIVEITMLGDQWLPIGEEWSVEYQEAGVGQFLADAVDEHRNVEGGTENCPDALTICRASLAANGDVVAGEIELGFLGVGELPSDQHLLDHFAELERCRRRRPDRQGVAIAPSGLGLDLRLAGGELGAALIELDYVSNPTSLFCEGLIAGANRGFVGAGVLDLGVERFGFRDDLRQRPPQPASLRLEAK